MISFFCIVGGVGCDNILSNFMAPLSNLKYSILVVPKNPKETTEYSFKSCDNV